MWSVETTLMEFAFWKGRLLLVKKSLQNRVISGKLAEVLRCPQKHNGKGVIRTMVELEETSERLWPLACNF